MYIMIDNFDSFVYNLKAYFQELGREILVKRCDEITLKELEEMNPEGIILSPPAPSFSANIIPQNGEKMKPYPSPSRCSKKEISPL